MKVEPVAWANYREDGVMVGLAEEACTAWRNPKPLYDHAIPPGYALVRVEDAETAYVCVGCEAIYWDDGVSCDCQVPSLNKFREVNVTAAKGE